MPYFAYIVGGWVQKEGKMCLRNKSMAPMICKITCDMQVCMRYARLHFICKTTFDMQDYI